MDARKIFHDSIHEDGANVKNRDTLESRVLFASTSILEISLPQTIRIYEIYITATPASVRQYNRSLSLDISFTRHDHINFNKLKLSPFRNSYKRK